MTKDIKALTEKLRAFAKARDWAQFHSPKNLACALCAESGELLENFQWLTEEQSRQLTDKQKSAVATEIADVFLYLLQLSDALSIDPLLAAADKLEINEQRYPVERARGNAKKYTDL
ncbi:MAG: nucleotide pyrophosphohydrolase [Rhodospirillaceae bacterium]